MPPIEALDRLTLEGSITGYTVEPEPRYLDGSRPALSYGMYALDRAARSNLRRFAEAMDALGGDISFHRTMGCTLHPAGRVDRSDQLTVVAWFRSRPSLQRAVRLLSRRYVAGSHGAMPGSWHCPDARICGLEEEVPETIPAYAHRLFHGGQALVVLGLTRRPPLPGMTTQTVHLLHPWAGYLEGTLEATG